MGEGPSLTSPVHAGMLAGLGGFAVFLVLHHLWIVPIWFIAPVGSVVAAGAGAAVGSAYGELLGRLPPRPWTAIAVVVIFGLILAPAVAIAELRGPIFIMEGDGGGSLLVSGSEAVVDATVGLLGTTAVAGAVLGWRLGRSRRAAARTGLAGLALALGPGHNIPLLGGTSAVEKELVMLAAVAIVAALLLVEGHARLSRSGPSLSGERTPARLAGDLPTSGPSRGGPQTP